MKNAQYSSATNRCEKSAIVSDIVDTIRSKSPFGGFVKSNDSDGLYYEVGDRKLYYAAFTPTV